MVNKLQGRSPLKHLVRCAASLSPVNMAVKPEQCVLKFEKLVNVLHKHQRLTSIEADFAKEQFDIFLAREVIQNKNEFKNFDYSKQRLDEFLGHYMVGNTVNQFFWKLCIFVFTVSHGQSDIERGFNVNKDMLVENMEIVSMKALRLTYNEVLCSGKDVNSSPISSELSLSCKPANVRYKKDLADKNNLKQREATGQKKKTPTG